ncbi:hypothetical protein KDW_08670 [Dictyobacter vulcani]|uniref:Uncharacterized protein n=1 Tax=Dictyobacter vulcani TaxID=2607529 RepID=A0A5J4KGQ8_9CHLR|nr:hypothetical protein [Dictyobacter vulcani]GER86705.1 hypothetical protein KDW_08670 [Dictyobacter vulcani]
MTANVAQFAGALQAISTLTARQPAQPVRVAIIGSTSFSPLSLVTSFIAHLPTNCVILSSQTDKVNQQALTTARHYGYKVEEFMLDWTQLEAGSVDAKDNELIHSASIIVAFWGNQGQGIASILAAAREAKIPVFTISPPTSLPRPIQRPLF